MINVMQMTELVFLFTGGQQQYSKTLNCYTDDCDEYDFPFNKLS